MGSDGQLMYIHCYRRNLLNMWNMLNMPNMPNLHSSMIDARRCARWIQTASVQLAATIFVSVIATVSASAQTTDSVKVVIDSAVVAKTGVYTEEQAAGGKEVFSRACVECHTRKDMSSADFRLNWSGRSAFDLFDRIRSTMPDASPGSMTVDEYLTVTTYLLKLNGMPTGSIPMPADSTLKSVTLALVAVEADTTPPGPLPSLAARRTVLPQLHGYRFPLSPRKK